MVVLKNWLSKLLKTGLLLRSVLRTVLKLNTDGWMPSFYFWLLWVHFPSVCPSWRCIVLACLSGLSPNQNSAVSHSLIV